MMVIDLGATKDVRSTFAQAYKVYRREHNDYNFFLISQ